MEAFKPITFDDIKAIKDLFDNMPVPDITTMVKGATEALIKNVLSQYLKREIFIDDAKDVTIYYEKNVLDGFKLTYKGKLLGFVYYNYGISGNPVSISFKPL